MKTAVIYARYSSDSQTEQSIDGQLRVCEEYAKKNNILIVQTYIDRAMTGTNDKRPDFQQMLKDSDNKDSQYNSQSTYNYSKPENTYAQPQRTNQIYNSQKVQQVINNKSTINQQLNPMLQKALDFAKGKDQHFVSFCNRYNIDYRNNYNNAVLRYYQAYLRSIQPPKK